MISVTPTHLPVFLDAGHVSLSSKYKTGCQKLNCYEAEMSLVTPVLTVIGIWFLNVGSAHTLWTSAMYLIAKTQPLSSALIGSNEVVIIVGSSSICENLSFVMLFCQLPSIANVADVLTKP